MILLIVIALVFISLLLFPFLLGRTALAKKDEPSLQVRSDNVRDPRYFPKAFTALMNKALLGYDGSGTIFLSKPEALLEPPLPPGDANAVVLSRGSFQSAARVFHKELYCLADGKLAAGTELRAIACMGALTLGEGCVVHRWADGGKSLTAMAGCQLGISASSAGALYIGAGCQFRRLYAPAITVGTAAPLPQLIPDPDTAGEPHRGLRFVEDGERLTGNIITRRDLVIGERACVTGHIKSRRRIHVKRGARIYGNLIADGDIVLESGVVVGGIVFSQSDIYIGPNCQIGREGHIKSAVARGSIVLAEGAGVFGYVGGELTGSTVKAADYYSIVSDRF